MQFRRSSMALALVIGCQLAATATLAFAEKDRGGGREGGRGGGGGGGGAPLPALGATLLGQAAGAGGLYAMWRRRRSQRAKLKATAQIAQGASAPRAPSATT